MADGSLSGRSLPGRALSGRALSGRAFSGRGKDLFVNDSADLVRLRLDIAYDGTGFSGWATQPGRRTVQTEIETALRTLFRSPELRLVVAGRTDAGVHAVGQVAHCDVAAARWASISNAPSGKSGSRATGLPDRGLRRLRGLLAPDITVFGLQPAPAGFDARFSAIWRRYRYRITDADWGADPLRRYDTAVWRHSLDAVGMAAAAAGLLGLNDFAAFCRRREGATTVRILQELSVVRSAELIEITVRADAFCHSMVRSLVGALAAVGDGTEDRSWPASLLALAMRADAVTVAPARGLTLLEVGYPADDQLAARAREARAVRQPISQ
ncbi:MAG: tRNA pseudouridine(38-40) synthase TruA [Frankiales bacterium]|nr:tRNA pseudouridine(38-40) synthase TruA [Frankiales bacterium]